jgi:hypothetical protein
MIDQQFCNILEYRISGALASSSDDRLKGFWCDGVLLPDAEIDYSPKTVNDKRKIILTACTGITGQDKYELTIHLGSKSLSRYARGLDITECIPSAETDDWVEVDPALHRISIQLY